MMENEECFQEFFQVAGLAIAFRQLSSQHADVLYSTMKLLISLSSREECKKAGRAVNCMKIFFNILTTTNVTFSTSPFSNGLRDIYPIKATAVTCLLSFGDVQSWVDFAQTTGAPKVVEAVLPLLETNSSPTILAGLQLTAFLAEIGHVEKSTRYAEAIVSTGLIPVIVLRLTGDTEMRQSAAIALSWLTSNPEARKAIYEVQGLFSLVSLLLQPLPDLQERVLWGIANFCSDQNYQKAVVDSGAIFPAVKFLTPGQGSDPVLSNALKIVLLLAQVPDYRQALKDAGTIVALQKNLLSPNKTIKMASQRVIGFLS
eukprot:TRINITY_DN6730_c0_g1_i1.p1 TRINITY_DN6730_c0_g1~~TRINITY_DN6730_c0_g1_i1.p1  ORF type:complete len:343 (-),score=93.58 TRINITY_DN6730_c0_g1_i1:2-946(-)